MLPAGAVTLPFTIRLLSSCAANFFPVLSPEETGSSVCTLNTLPPGSVEARAGSEVSNVQIRLKVRVTKYFVTKCMEVDGRATLVCATPDSVRFPGLFSETHYF